MKLPGLLPTPRRSFKVHPFAPELKPQLYPRLFKRGKKMRFACSCEFDLVITSRKFSTCDRRGEVQDSTLIRPVKSQTR
jgi:hypothetical protein